VENAAFKRKKGVFPVKKKSGGNLNRRYILSKEKN
jgi:hypothetical protein